jgi:hypothetical protein
MSRAAPVRQHEPDPQPPTPYLIINHALERRRFEHAVSFERRHRRGREWIRFLEIVEWYVELNRGIMTEEVARTRAYDMLKRDLLKGEFEEAGRSRVLYLHRATPKARMTREWLQTAIEMFPEEVVRREYLDQCWIPRRLFDRLLAIHELPLSPARFEPQKDAVLSDEERAIITLAAYLRQTPQVRRIDAANRCRQGGFAFSGRAFQSRIWPKARMLAGLAEKASGGRKPK